MTIHIESDTAAAVRVTPAVTWHPHHTWDRATSQIDGYLVGGPHDRTELDVVTSVEADVRTYAPAATNLWLRGHVLAITVDSGKDGKTPPSLVIPVGELNDAVIREAIYRYHCGHYTDLTLDA